MTVLLIVFLIIILVYLYNINYDLKRKLSSHQKSDIEKININKVSKIKVGEETMCPNCFGLKSFCFRITCEGKGRTSEELIMDVSGADFKDSYLCTSYPCNLTLCPAICSVCNGSGTVTWIDGLFDDKNLSTRKPSKEEFNKLKEYITKNNIKY